MEEHKDKDKVESCPTLYYISERKILFTYSIINCTLSVHPLPKFARKGFEYLLVDSTIYISGGLFDSRIFSSLLKIDPPYKEVKELRPMRYPRHAHGFCRPLSHYLYVLGGTTCEGPFGKCEKYNICTNTWSSLPDIHSDYAELECIASNGRYLYVGSTFKQKLILEALDLMEEEKGWEVLITFEYGMKYWHMFQVNDAEFAILAKSGMYLWEHQHNSTKELASLPKAKSFTAQPPVYVNGKIFHVDQSTYDLHVFCCIRKRWEIIKGEDWNPL